MGAFHAQIAQLCYHFAGHAGGGLAARARQGRAMAADALRQPLLLRLQLGRAHLCVAQRV